VGKPEGKRSLGRPKVIRKGNIKNGSYSSRKVGMDQIDLAEDRDRLWGPCG
jgi:hypothetical protein